MGRGTRYQLVSESYPNDIPKSQSLVDKIKRRILAFRHSSSLLTSAPAKQLRYVGLAIFALVVLIASLPENNLESIDNGNRFGPFNIQYAFKNETKSAEAIRTGRQSQVKAAFLHAWNGYKKHAWLHDEVQPISGDSKDPYVGWAATLVDSLDALYILGLQTEFDLALESVKTINFTKPNTERVPVFETTIRYLGGLLGAYDVSGGKYPILLEKARELGDFLFLAFNTTNGMPVPYYQWQKPEDKLHGENGVLVAQVGSLSLEFTRLAQLTGDRKYFDAITRITNHFDKAQNTTKLPGLWPSQINTDALAFTGRAFTLGAWADSLYEYLPKEHILLNGRTTDQYLNMYQKALEGANKHHFFRPNIPGNHDILFTGSVDVNGGVPSLRPEVQHLGCFVGGMVALGARINKSKKELKTAAKLTEGCVWAYQNTATGIMPEIFFVQQCPETGSCHWVGQGSGESGHQYGFTRVKDSSYQLRPEAIESVFIMYRITGDPIWQQKGWNMFQAIMSHTTTSIANARVNDVTNPSPVQQDSMESFWLAETLKYFYLLFSKPDLISLDDFVLNTEAHPFRQRDHLFDI